MKKVQVAKTKAEVLACCGQKEDALVKIGYTESDIDKLIAIMELEFRLTASPKFKPHLNAKNKMKAKEITLEELNEQEDALFAGFSAKVGFHAASVVFAFREGVYKAVSLVIPCVVFRVSAYGINSNDLPTLNLTNNILVKYLSINAELLKNTGAKHPFEALSVVNFLNDFGFIHSRTGDNQFAIEMYKQGWLIGNKYFLEKRVPVMDNFKAILDKYAQGFTSDSKASTSFIAKRGINEMDDCTWLIKKAMQKPILDECTNFVTSNNWAGSLFKSGLESYVSSKYVKKVLSKVFNKVAEADVEKGLMLCFSAICLAQHQNPQKADMSCLNQFIAVNPDLVKRILLNHPQYCVDGGMIPLVKHILCMKLGAVELPPIATIDITLGEFDDGVMLVGDHEGKED